MVEPLSVARRHQSVRGSQRQPELVVGRHEVRIGAGVELVAGVADKHALANFVQDRGHSVVAELAKHRGEGDRREVLDTEVVRGEEVRRRVPRFEIARLGLVHHRGQLMEVADEDELHAAERRAGNRTEPFQRGGNLIEEVRPHHRRLVDDQRVQ